MSIVQLELDQDDAVTLNIEISNIGVEYVGSTAERFSLIDWATLSLESRSRVLEWFHGAEETWPGFMMFDWNQVSGTGYWTPEVEIWGKHFRIMLPYLLTDGDPTLLHRSKTVVEALFHNSNEAYPHHRLYCYAQDLHFEEKLPNLAYMRARYFNYTNQYPSGDDINPVEIYGIDSDTKWLSPLKSH